MSETIGELIEKLIDVKIEVREGDLKRKDLIPELTRELDRRLEWSKDDLESRVEKLEDE